MTKEKQQPEENCLGQETGGMSLDQWKSGLWSDDSNFEIFGSTRHVSVCGFFQNGRQTEPTWLTLQKQTTHDPKLQSVSTI